MTIRPNFGKHLTSVAGDASLRLRRFVFAAHVNMKSLYSLLVTRLAQLERHIHTSSDEERLFSITRSLLEVKRSRLLAKNASMMAFCYFIVYPMHWIDPLISFFRRSVSQSVCLLTDRLSNDYVHNSLPIFTKFCMRLRNVLASSPIVCERNRK